MVPGTAAGPEADVGTAAGVPGPGCRVAADWQPADAASAAAASAARAGLLAASARAARAIVGPLVL
jgi:hypothetical protein